MKKKTWVKAVMKKREREGSPFERLFIREKEEEGVRRVKRARRRYVRRMRSRSRSRGIVILCIFPIMILCVLTVYVTLREKDAAAAQEEAPPIGVAARIIPVARSAQSIKRSYPSEEATLAPPVWAGDIGVLFDVFEVTGYCSCDKCCGKKEIKLTKSGTVPRASHTVAADPKVLPLGSRIVIDGVLYTVEDTGKAVKGKIIDIYFDTHEEAVEFGRQQKEVYLIE